MDMLTMAFWKPLKDSSEWVDVSPVSVKQDLGDEDVAAIEYQPQAEDVMGYMYAAMDLPAEGSDRALELSRKGILCNMSGYTAWRFRLKVWGGGGGCTCAWITTSCFGYWSANPDRKYWHSVNLVVVGWQASGDRSSVLGPWDLW